MESTVNLFSAITEIITKITINDNMSNNPRLRRDNRIRTIHASLAIENNSLSLDQVTLPEDRKEYLAIYTTEYDDSYIIETIESTDIVDLKRVLVGIQERVIENEFNFEMSDEQSTIITTQQNLKIRKLNRKIGDNLKLLYGYEQKIILNKHL